MSRRQGRRCSFRWGWPGRCPWGEVAFEVWVRGQIHGCDKMRFWQENSPGKGPAEWLACCCTHPAKHPMYNLPWPHLSLIGPTRQEELTLPGWLDVCGLILQWVLNTVLTFSFISFPCPTLIPTVTPHLKNRTATAAAATKEPQPSCIHMVYGPFFPLIHTYHLILTANVCIRTVIFYR